MVQKNMQGQTTKTSIRQYQDQRKQAARQKNRKQRHKVSNQSRNQIPAQEEATSQPATIPLSLGMCTPI
jgi:hypothetical protein